MYTPKERAREKERKQNMRNSLREIKNLSESVSRELPSLKKSSTKEN